MITTAIIIMRCEEEAKQQHKQSLDPAAEGDSITNRKHANFDSGVHSQGLVELQHEVPVVPNILPERSIRGCHHRTVP